jgi:NAD(P)-dependent dehydrogenase (short-subunit alcohol dehydrogenase family)
MASARGTSAVYANPVPFRVRRDKWRGESYLLGMDRIAKPRTALVTGANRGLGLETCRQLAELGMRVLLTSRADDGRAAAEGLSERGLGAEHRMLDVVDAASIASLSGDLQRDGIFIDVLVNNAGVVMDGFDAEVARRTLDVNFFGALGVTDALLPLMTDGSSVVMVSSGMGEVSSLAPHLQKRLLDPELSRGDLVELMRSFVRDVAQNRHAEAGWPSSAYRVSKAGLNGLVRILARELGPRIRVNAVCPGWVRTRMGGAGATRSVEQGARSIMWATSENGPTGGFFRDGRPIRW